MSEFKVGDKVRVLSGGEGVITYGPVNSTFGTFKLMVVKQDGDEERAFRVSDLESIPKFAVGDRVKKPATGINGIIVAGPYTACDGEQFWVVEERDGSHSTPREDGLTRVAGGCVNVGDRVRVVVADPEFCPAEESTFVGRVGTVTELKKEMSLPYKVRFGDGPHGAPDGYWWCQEVELLTEPAADTYEHDGVVYDLSARYRDVDGDPWTFKRFGTDVHGGCNGHEPKDTYDTLEMIVRYYGPLTKIID
ncbi:phiSA1p31-related protein [Streptomyces sp. DH12]|uniref:phiSA1p31-related protein n=1 Tax=Streptomyces sp. DH12 TaxID=2857010 RepID=UPI001E4D6455|nr:phiSA1p31-related protein [Streptomyces sp. DH12]